MPIDIDRSAEEAFDAVLKAVKVGMKLKTSREDPPSGKEPGYIEAVERTLVFGFYDDLAIRVPGPVHRAPAATRPHPARPFP